MLKINCQQSKMDLKNLKEIGEIFDKYKTTTNV